MMRQLFPGYYRPTESEFEEMWRTCIFAFDTNVVLNFYRYTPSTQQRLFDILSRLQDRIWLPHQVAFEYQKNRSTVIAEQLRAYSGITKVLDDLVKTLEKELKAFQRHSFVDIDQIKVQLLSPIEEVKTILRESEAQHPNLLTTDPIRERVDNLFNGRIGQGYSEKVLAEHYQKAADRYKQEVPPGYKDAGKGGAEQFGDAIIWFQLLDHAHEVKQPIIFTTADTKDDWWLRINGQSIGPQPKLIQEMLDRGGVKFYLYHIDQFMNRAEEFLQLQTEQAAIEEVREVRLEDEQSRIVLENIVRTGGVPQAITGANVPSYAASLGMVMPPNLAYDATRRLTESLPLQHTTRHFSEQLSAFDAARRLTESLPLQDAARHFSEQLSAFDAARRLTESLPLHDMAQRLTQNSSLYDAARRLSEQSLVHDTTQHFPERVSTNLSDETEHRSHDSHQAIEGSKPANDYDQRLPSNTLENE